MNPLMAHGLELTVRAPVLHPVLPLNMSLGWLASIYSRPVHGVSSPSLMAPGLSVPMEMKPISELVLRHRPAMSLPTDYVMLLVLSPLLPENATLLPRRNAHAALLLSILYAPVTVGMIRPRLLCVMSFLQMPLTSIRLTVDLVAPWTLRPAGVSPNLTAIALPVPVFAALPPCLVNVVTYFVMMVMIVTMVMTVMTYYAVCWRLVVPPVWSLSRVLTSVVVSLPAVVALRAPRLLPLAVLVLLRVLRPLATTFSYPHRDIVVGCFRGLLVIGYRNARLNSICVDVVSVPHYGRRYLPTTCLCTMTYKGTCTSAVADTGNINTASGPSDGDDTTGIH